MIRALAKNQVSGENDGRREFLQTEWSGKAGGVAVLASSEAVGSQ